MWITGGPNSRIVPGPSKFQPEGPLTSEIDPLFNIGDGGIYPKSQLNQLQTLLQFPYTKDAIS